jgi:hypothetical protein
MLAYYVLLVEGERARTVVFLSAAARLILERVQATVQNREPFLLYTYCRALRELYLYLYLADREGIMAWHGIEF